MPVTSTPSPDQFDRRGGRPTCSSPPSATPTPGAIRAALGEHGVLVFPRQDLTREQQVESTAALRCRARPPGAGVPLRGRRSGRGGRERRRQAAAGGPAVPRRLLVQHRDPRPRGAARRGAPAQRRRHDVGERGRGVRRAVTADAGVPRRPDRAPRRRRQVLVGDAPHAGGGTERAGPRALPGQQPPDRVRAPGHRTQGAVREPRLHGRDQRAEPERERRCAAHPVRPPQQPCVPLPPPLVRRPTS